jgi:hypothetical protein
MATFKHTQGAVSGGKRVTATDVFTKNADGVIIEVDQPAGSILEEVIVRFTNTSTHAASSTAGYELGTTSSGTEIAVNTNGFLDTGTSIPLNAVYYLNSGRSAAGWSGDTQHDISSPGDADAYTDVERTLYLTFKHGNQNITTNSNVEVNFIFTHLN